MMGDGRDIREHMKLKYKIKGREDMTNKKIVKFEIMDGMLPERGPAGVFNLRCPMGMDVKPGAKLDVKLGIRCDHPVHVFEARHMVLRDIRLVDGIWAANDAGNDLVLRMENLSGREQLFERGDILARCFVVDNSEWEIG